ncbi:hypothetical protein PR048_012510 [Dryococelus australis]|uniref:Uncharacterized protein n=1 Tax=Dryococelus australis TaxID=614101 RepID=A0ABQ9HQA2_9NEOP|nr:hypothetical protein PR048_012510 [Dryococelus australis]
MSDAELQNAGRVGVQAVRGLWCAVLRVGAAGQAWRVRSDVCVRARGRDRQCCLVVRTAQHCRCVRGGGVSAPDTMSLAIPAANIIHMRATPSVVPAPFSHWLRLPLGNRSAFPLACAACWRLCHRVLNGEMRPDVLLASVAILLAVRPPPRRTWFDSWWVRPRILTCGNRAGQCRWSGGFLGNLPFALSLHSGTASFSPCFTVIGFQELDVKSCLNLSTPLYLSIAGMKGRGKREIPEKILQSVASSGAIPTCENPVTRPGIEPGSPWWEARRLTAQPPRPQIIRKNFRKVGSNREWSITRSRYASAHAGQQNGQQHVGKLFANQRLSTYSPASSPANSERFTTRNGQSDKRPALKASRSLVFVTSWITLAQSSPSTVTGANHCAFDIGIFVPKIVESNLRVIELRNFSGLYSLIFPLIDFFSVWVPTKANKVRLPEEWLPDFGTWQSCRTMPMVGMFSRRSPVSPALAFRSCSILTSLPPQRLSIPLGKRSDEAQPRVECETSPALVTGARKRRYDRSRHEETSRLTQRVQLHLQQSVAPDSHPSFFFADLPWSSRLVHHRSGVREALGSNPGYDTGDKIDFKRVYTEVTFAIESEFIRHALDDSAPIADLQENKRQIPYCQMWGNIGARANEKTAEIRLYNGLWSLAYSGARETAMPVLSRARETPRPVLSGIRGSRTSSSRQSIAGIMSAVHTGCLQLRHLNRKFHVKFAARFESTILQTMYFIRLTSSIGLKYVINALNELEPIVNLQENNYQIPCYVVCSKIGATANEQLTEARRSLNSQDFQVSAYGIRAVFLRLLVKFLCRETDPYLTGPIRARQPDITSAALKLTNVIAQPRLAIPARQFTALRQTLPSSHQCEPSSIPGRVIPGLSQVIIVPDSAPGRRVFSVIPYFPCPSIPVLLQSHLALPLTALKTSLLRAAQISQLDSMIKNIISRYDGFLYLTSPVKGGNAFADGPQPVTSHKLQTCAWYAAVQQARRHFR